MRRMWLAILLLLAVLEIPYGPAPLQRLDLTVPAAKNFATVVFLHGGSLTSGDKADDDYRHVCEPFVHAGMACANVNYRLFPGVKWPAPADDAAAAVKRVRAEVAARGGDPHRLFLVGHSSGCLLVSLLGTDSKYAVHDVAGVVAMGCRLNDRIDASGVPEEKIKQHFRKDVYDGGFGSVAALNDAVPAAHVSRDMPPFLVLVAEAEQVNPPILADAQAFAKAAPNGRVKIVVVKDRTHMTAIRRLGEEHDAAFAAIRDFIGAR
jgi:acetyl esterase/lipase